MKETIFNFIHNRQQELENAKKDPTHVLDIEIYNQFGKLESQKYLKELIEIDQTVIWGKTMNGLWFKINTQKSI